VPGWSGAGNRVAAPIQPGDSLTVHLTLKRAGTFIYHTHLNDIEQVTSGLYGPLIVLPPGEVFDSVHDLLFVGGWDGTGGPNLPAPMVVNGVHEEPPLELTLGATYRLRFINIAPAGNFRFRITRDGELGQWRMVAKDGADLPPHRAVPGPAAYRIFAGETFDAEFTPAEPGDYLLSAPSSPSTVFYQRVLRVR
jgi:FtsP/CotA-like multicopper oxidase with cupredoxin domain